MSETVTLEALQAEKQRREQLKALQAEKARRQGASDPLAGLGRLPTDPQTDAPEAPQSGNRVSRAIGDFAEQRAFPGAAGSIVQGGARVAQSIAEDPLKTLVVDPLTAPVRATRGLTGASEALSQGRFREAGQQAIEGVTAAGEAALMFAPGASVASRGVGVAARPVARTGAQQFIDDAAKVGVEPTLPAAFPQTAGRLAKPVSENAAGGVTIRAGADKSLRQSEGALDSAADAFSVDAGPTDAGQAALSGTRAQLTARPSSQTAGAQYLTFREKARNVYDDAFKGINQTAAYAPSATVNALNDITSRFDNTALQDLFSLPRTEKLRDAIEKSGELSINDLRNARTAIREIQNQSKLIKTVDEAALERIEGALTEDIFSAVTATAGKDAARKLRTADRFYRRNITSIRLALKPFLKEGATQEQAFRSIIGAAKGQGKGDIRQLRALRRSLTPQQMDDVSAGVLRELGKAKEGGDFSPETFSRAWQTMGDDAKAALFNRAQRPELRENLDALARVIDRQASVERLSNRSQSGMSLQNVGTLVFVGANPVAGISSIVGANVMGRLMMSPSFTRALVDLQKLSPSISKASTAHQKGVILANLNKAAKADPSIKAYVLEITSALERANDNISREIEQQATQAQ